MIDSPVFVSPSSSFNCWLIKKVVMVCSKTILLFFAFACLASAKHKAMNKFNFCDFFPIKKPQAMIDSPSSTTPLPVAYVGPIESVQMPQIPEYGSIPPVSTQQEVQQLAAEEPELLNPQEEIEVFQDQELQFPPQHDFQYPPSQVMQYPPQPIMQYSPQQVIPYAPQQVEQPTQQGLQYQIQQDVNYPLPQSEVPPPHQELQYQYPQYPIQQQQQQQQVQPPKQELQYQPQKGEKDQKFHQQVQLAQKFQYQQQPQEVKPPKFGLEYQLQQKPTHELLQLPQLALKFPPHQGTKVPPHQGTKFPPQQGNSPPYFQGPSNGYGSSAELSHYPQQMGPNKQLIGYLDKQNNFHNLRPYHVYVRQQHPDSSQYLF